MCVCVCMCATQLKTLAKFIKTHILFTKEQNERTNEKKFSLYLLFLKCQIQTKHRIIIILIRIHNFFVLPRVSDGYGHQYKGKRNDLCFYMFDVAIGWTTCHSINKRLVIWTEQTKW